MNSESPPRDVATTDELTGLLNLRGFNLLADYLMVASQRRAEPLSITFIGLDNFGQINSRCGLEEGDKALVAMAGLMKNAFRDTDVIARAGGDKFAIIFADTDEAGAFIALEYLREQVGDFNRTSGQPWQLSYSVGIVEYNELVFSGRADILRRAENEMQKMKAIHQKSVGH